MLHRDEDQQKHAAEQPAGKRKQPRRKRDIPPEDRDRAEDQHRAAQGSIGLAVFFHDPVSLLFFSAVRNVSSVMAIMKTANTRRYAGGSIRIDM